MDRPSRHAGPRSRAIASDQALKVGALRRIKFTATALLAFCALLFLLARTFEPRFPALAWVAAFAEAAMIGGLADWYAVVALFSAPARLADSPYRHHPRESGAHRRQSGNLHRGQFSRPRAGRAKAQGGGFCRDGGRLAGRSAARRRARAIRHQALARGDERSAIVRPQDVRRRPDPRGDQG